ncbi:MAG: hypothetical protein B9S32_17855 [Verrucomicrobia bacterium Tous-C9LFEB]|nr:MAG: hypothetical protein B9S32_17855 [Verrucomicrobia bacterium Tous-C9LFEB]
MKVTNLTQCNLVVSRIAYGCMRLAGGWDRRRVGAVEIERGIGILELAVACGYTLFDHADIYGDTACETIFGHAMAKHPEWRERLVVATKCGIRWADQPNPGVPYRYDFSYDHIKRSVEESLGRSQIEAIDLLQLHRPDYLADPVEIARAFTELRAEGKVKHFGVSNFRPSLVRALQQALPWPLAVNQVEIHLNRLDCLTDGTLDQCLELKMTPLAWSPLDRGRLATGYKPEENDPRAADRLRLLQALDTMGAELGCGRSEVALAWLLKHPSGIIPIIGSVTPDRIRDAVRALEVPMSRENWYRILEAARGERAA